LAETHSAGITQIPVPLRTADNSTFVACRHSIYQVEPWMPGVADYHQQPNPDRLAAMLICLAHWHQAATAFRPVGDEGDWFSQTTAGLSPGLADRHNQVRHWTPEALGHLRVKLRSSKWTEFVGLGERVLELFPRAARVVEGELRIARGMRVPLQPCLRDIWHDHLLLTGNEVTGLIDAHACRSDSVATDLSRLLGSLVGDDRSAWDVGLRAYQQVRPLSLEEQALVAVFDRSAVLLGGLVWLTWHCLDGRIFENPQQVCQRLSWIVGRLEHLAQRI
jgi:Ser/Thr protein kinase RdoA (MazF antagonist)